MSRAAALGAAVALLLAVATALAPGAGAQELRSPPSFDRKPDLHQRTAREVAAIAGRVPEVREELERLQPLELSEAAEGYAALDRRVVEQAHVIPYGHRRLPFITSKRINRDQALWHPVLQADFTTFGLTQE